MTTPSWMPPLPCENFVDENGLWDERYGPYTAEQMRQAQLDAVEAYKASLKPVAWAVVGSMGSVWNTTHKVEEAGGWQRASHGGITSVVPLYRLDEE